MEYSVLSGIRDLENTLSNMVNREYLVLSGIRDLEDALSNMVKNINDKDQTTLYEKDFNQVKIFSEFFFNGDLKTANIIASDFETAVRELIPASVWELLGNKLLHERDRKIKQDNLSEVQYNVKDIIVAYKNKNYEEAEKLEKIFFDDFSKTVKFESKDELLIKCLKKLQQSEDEESKELVKKIKNTIF